MNNTKNNVFKNIAWAMISLLIAIFTIYTIDKQSKTFSLARMFELIQQGKLQYIFIGAVCMLLFIYAEGEALRLILNKIARETTRSQGFLYSAADIYFSAITPSASGGQPASLYFMVKDGLSGTTSTICLIYNLLMYNASIVFICILCLVFRFDIFMKYDMPCKILIIIGIVLLTGLMIGFYCLLKKASLLWTLGIGLIGFVHHVHIIKNREKWEDKLRTTIDKYSDMADILVEDKILATKVFLVNLFQRGIQICISVCIYLGLGGYISYALDVWFTQAYSTIGSNCIPVPGAMGVIDYLLLNGFENMMSEDLAVHTEMLTRGISFYICIAVSLVTVGIGYYRRRNKRPDEQSA